MQKIRIVHVAEAAGGVERYLYALLKNSDSQKIENYLIASQHYEMGKFKKMFLVNTNFKWLTQLVSKMIKL